tara:strand:- start:10719 stop:11993 length:1275 start_codon:yes stop_codon:yes gene_type:complete
MSMILPAICAFAASSSSMLLAVSFQQAVPGPDLPSARRGFTTRLVVERRVEEQPATPPPERFKLVRYAAPQGANAAYLSCFEPGDVTRPAIVWLTGGFPAARGGADIWRDAPPESDQTARAFLDAGVVLLIPTVRGTAGNPGNQEAYFGEVDDVLAAARYLKNVVGVDPERVYLGGHSTGGTLALLVAESTDMFRAVFSFGPVLELVDYGDRQWPFDVADAREWRLRSPLHYLNAITSPTFVFEGHGGNREDLAKLVEANDNSRVRPLLLRRDDHFTLLTPIQRLLAAQIVATRRGAFSLDLDQAKAASIDFWNARREQRDLTKLAELRVAGRRWGDAVIFRATIRARSSEPMEAVRSVLLAAGFRATATRKEADARGRACLRATFARDLAFGSESILSAASAIAEAASDEGLIDEGWTADLAR